MNDFKELDPPRKVRDKWYVGIYPHGHRYLHKDLLLYLATHNAATSRWDGLFDTELEALSTSRQYYIKHTMNFPYEIRYRELNQSTNNTTSCQSEPMVFK